VNGVHEAGNPWFDYIFGSSDAARANLGQWVLRTSSEVFVDRCTLLLQDTDECIGGFIGISAAELIKCRRSDAWVLLTKAAPENRKRIEECLVSSRGLFAPPAEDEYYLSKIWVAPSHRGRGHFRILMHAWLEQGQQAGFMNYRLDVAADRDRPRRLYEHFGFSTMAQTASADNALTYLSMIKRAGEME
jgi:ribosomal protein S18 acetylase RimI-like enzyme